MVTGYNLTGFVTTGFGDSERRAAGPFLTIRLKFDEESLVGLSRSLTRRPGTDRRPTDAGSGPVSQPTPSE